MKSSVASQVCFYGNREDNYKLTVETQDIRNSQGNLGEVEPDGGFITPNFKIYCPARLHQIKQYTTGICFSLTKVPITQNGENVICLTKSVGKLAFTRKKIEIGILHLYNNQLKMD